MTTVRHTLIDPVPEMQATGPEPAQPITGAITRRSELRAGFALQGGRTVMIDRYYSAPLRFSRSFRPHGGGNGLCVYTSDVSPGVLNGDVYHSEWHLGEGTHVMLSSTSATRLHPTPSLPSSVKHHFTLEQGAVLEYFPEGVIPFKGSSSTLTTRFDLRENAVLAYADIWAAGRVHRGELFQFQRYDSLTDIRLGKQIIVWDRFGLAPERDDPTESAALMHYTHTAALWMIAPGLGSAELELVRQRLQHGSRILAGASMLAAGGIGVRMLGMAAWELQEQCLLLWNAVRPVLLGSEMPPFRK